MQNKKIEVKTDHHLEEQKRSKVEVEIEKGKRAVFNLDQLKSGGYIRQRQKDLFTVRLRCPGGRVAFKKLKKIAEVGARYSQKDYVHISVRQSIEIPYVHYKDFANIAEELQEVGQQIASCGPRVRVPTACSGCEYNPNGLIDTQKLCQEIDQKYFGIQCNHKFKISLSGCPIDCFRTNEMDLGFQGAVEPVWDEATCTGCRICGYACKEGAITNDSETGKPIIDRSKCLYCADCIRACPTNSWKEGKKGLVVRVGGRHGRHPMNGAVIAALLPEEKMGLVIEKVIEWYNVRGKGKGRVRIGDILREKWSDFLEFINPVLGEYAVTNPPKPDFIEIHSFQTGWKPETLGVKE
ncbi:MAG: 4Fe-4S dicluster domain-containing protein [bacterium]|nr:4Fe-4S dicluster domain-containing protein [bacterium]